jgi:hypothetical protein
LFHSLNAPGSTVSDVMMLRKVLAQATVPGDARFQAVCCAFCILGYLGRFEHETALGILRLRLELLDNQWGSNNHMFLYSLVTGVRVVCFQPYLEGVRKFYDTLDEWQGVLSYCIETGVIAPMGVTLNLNSFTRRVYFHCCEEPMDRDIGSHNHYARLELVWNVPLFQTVAGMDDFALDVDRTDTMTKSVDVNSAGGFPAAIQARYDALFLNGMFLGLTYEFELPSADNCGNPCDLAGNPALSDRFVDSVKETCDADVTEDTRKQKESFDEGREWKRSKCGNDQSADVLEKILIRCQRRLRDVSEISKVWKRAASNGKTNGIEQTGRGSWTGQEGRNRGRRKNLLKRWIWKV